MLCEEHDDLIFYRFWSAHACLKSLNNNYSCHCSFSGDYPKLPPISIINKDHWEPWTCPEDRRDYCEPLIIYEHMLAEDRGEWPITDPGVWGIPFWKQWLCFLGAVGTGVILFTVPQKYNFIHFKPFLARHIPEPGKVHYTYAHRSPDLIYKHWNFWKLWF